MDGHSGRPVRGAFAEHLRVGFSRIYQVMRYVVIIMYQPGLLGVWIRHGITLIEVKFNWSVVSCFLSVATDNQ
jgi:hypothetical protein